MAVYSGVSGVVRPDQVNHCHVVTVGLDFFFFWAKHCSIANSRSKESTIRVKLRDIIGNEWKLVMLGMVTVHNKR